MSMSWKVEENLKESKKKLTERNTKSGNIVQALSLKTEKDLSMLSWSKSSEKVFSNVYFSCSKLSDIKKLKKCSNKV